MIKQAEDALSGVAIALMAALVGASIGGPG